MCVIQSLLILFLGNENKKTGVNLLSDMRVENSNTKTQWERGLFKMALGYRMEQDEIKEISTRSANVWKSLQKKKNKLGEPFLEPLN